MTGTPDVIQIDRADNVRNGEDRTPRGALVVGKIDRLGGLLDSAHARKTDKFRACHVPGTAELPGVDYVTDHLTLVRIAWTGVNFNSSVLVSGGAGTPKGRNVQLPPIRVVAAGNTTVVIIRVQHHGQAHLLQIVVAVGLLRLFLGFA